MMNWKKIGKKFLFPPTGVLIILAIISTVALVTVFVKGWDRQPIAYGIYMLSFYSLCVICAAIVIVFPRYYVKIKQKIYANKFGNKYITDATYRTHLSLYVSLGINLMYVAVNLFTGIWFCSVWSITLAVYYIILVVMRFLLLRFVGRVGIGKDRVKELKRSRLCGAILMTVNLALSGIVVLVIIQNKGFEYYGMLIYVMAMYAFYVTTHSIVDIFRYRKYSSPIMSTAKEINLAAALVSMLSLETAMLSQFSTEKTPPHFDQIMVGATGAGVCAIVVAMSVYTITGTNRELKELSLNNLET